MRRRRARAVGKGMNEYLPVASKLQDDLDHAIQAIALVGEPGYADSRYIGAMVVSFWEGGPAIPPDQVSTQFHCPEYMNPVKLAPYLRTIADQMEKGFPT